jgi:catechol 2,3-dioxygenase-like lactoylglutathione lyase family enzyme
MSLSGYRVRTSIAVSDMAEAAEFYEGKLGLSAGRDQSDESRIYACGGGTSLHVYASPAHAGTATATLATWSVADPERVVDQLSSSGVTFERYDDPALRTSFRGSRPRAAAHQRPSGRSHSTRTDPSIITSPTLQVDFDVRRQDLQVDSVVRGQARGPTGSRAWMVPRRNEQHALHMRRPRPSAVSVGSTEASRKAKRRGRGGSARS